MIEINHWNSGHNVKQMVWWKQINSIQGIPGMQHDLELGGRSLRTKQVSEGEIIIYGVYRHK